MAKTPPLPPLSTKIEDYESRQEAERQRIATTLVRSSLVFDSSSMTSRAGTVPDEKAQNAALEKIKPEKDCVTAATAINEYLAKENPWQRFLATSDLKPAAVAGAKTFAGCQANMNERTQIEGDKDLKKAFNNPNTP